MIAVRTHSIMFCSAATVQACVLTLPAPLSLLQVLRIKSVVPPLVPCEADPSH